MPGGKGRARAWSWGLIEQLRRTRAKSSWGRLLH